MRCENYQDSALEKWLRKNNWSTNRLVELVGCSRPIIWKAKRGIPISEIFANKIIKVTKGEVIPEINNRGRPKLMNFST